ncbi:hypothetical protein SCALM49S_02015 [Streptomyces californicus]
MCRPSRTRGSRPAAAAQSGRRRHLPPGARRHVPGRGARRGRLPQTRVLRPAPDDAPARWPGHLEHGLRQLPDRALDAVVVFLSFPDAEPAVDPDVLTAGPLPGHHPLLRTGELRPVHPAPAPATGLDADAAPLHLVRHRARLERRTALRLPPRRDRRRRRGRGLLPVQHRLPGGRSRRPGRGLRRHEGGELRPACAPTAATSGGSSRSSSSAPTATSSPTKPGTSSTWPTSTTGPWTARATGTRTSATGTSWAASSAQPDLFGSHKWKLGWLDGRQVVCVRGSADLTLEPVAAAPPPGGTLGTRLAVIRTGSGSALAVEARSATGNDRTTCAPRGSATSTDPQ